MIKSSYAFVLSFFCVSLNGDSLGSLLFNGNCATCHFKTKTVSAPSMMEVRENYRRAFSDKKEFVKYMSAWVANPSKERSIMLQAIDKHGLMPHLGFEAEALKETVEYIYDTDFTKK